jgi:hypothetical protein
MTSNRRVVFAVAGWTLLLTAAWALSMRGSYGWALFGAIPVLAGVLGTWFLRPETAGRAMRIGATIGAAGCAVFLVLGAEGLICILMALPFIVPLAAIGSLLAFWSGAPYQGKPSAAMCLLLPVSMFFDANAKPPVYSVTTSVIVNAAPERVWKHVVAFPEIKDQPDFVLRTGLAYPIRTRIEGIGGGTARSCDLSTGTVQERVTIWDEPRLLRFVVTGTPPAMKEMGLYGPIYPKHLEGYYISKEGQFELTPLSGGRTLVVGTSWYQHGLWPAQYWRLWSDMVVHRIHRRVLEHIRALSENRLD